MVRPMRKDDQWMYIRAFLYVTGIRYVDVSADKFSIIMLVCLSWNDPRLKWVPRRFANIESIRVSAYSIWTPELVQTLSIGSISQNREFPLSVDYKGNVSDCMTREIVSNCYMDFYNFPYDTHDCDLALELTGMRIERLALEVDPVESYEEKNGEWHLLYRNISLDPSGPMVLTFSLTRASSHYKATVFMPTLAILLASVGASWIPSVHSRPRTSLLAGLLLINVLLSRHTCRLVEGTQTLPRIVLLQNGCLGFLTIGIISSCVAEFVHRTQSQWTASLKQMQGVVDYYLLPAAGIFLMVVNQIVS
ncbi:acetylcholine receptor subunit beta [Galendromus occidentalis]|uniref:Acetylcholine receptor subunit beta n=1 Tax=Galendromus occidentalis TaxID=34638 RepID=A0AAJ6QV76_9ACAR|nr:acetylcholine receptor subunit beta [Galendromus occidentalis]